MERAPSPKMYLWFNYRLCLFPNPEREPLRRAAPSRDPGPRTPARDGVDRAGRGFRSGPETGPHAPERPGHRGAWKGVRPSDPRAPGPARRRNSPLLRAGEGGGQTRPPTVHAEGHAAHQSRRPRFPATGPGRNDSRRLRRSRAWDLPPQVHRGPPKAGPGSGPWLSMGGNPRRSLTHQVTPDWTRRFDLRAIGGMNRRRRRTGSSRGPPAAGCSGQCRNAGRRVAPTDSWGSP